MKVKLLLISALLFVASNGWAYNETDLLKFKALNQCEGCDLSGAKLWGYGGANLSGANLSGVDFSVANKIAFVDADLSNANLSFANLSGVDLPLPTSL